MDEKIATGTDKRLTPRERAALTRWITAQQIRADIEGYTRLHSRHTDHPQNRDAVKMLVDDLSLIGNHRLDIRTPYFKVDGLVLHNVEATLPANGRDGIVIISAHLDSTAGREFLYKPKEDPAPGADDDASGIAGVLSAARAIMELATAGIHHRTIRFVFFNAEENKQRGSRAYAEAAAGPTSQYAARDAAEGERADGGERQDIRGVYQLDMIGHNADGNPAFQLHVSYLQDGKVQAASLKLATSVVRFCGELGLDLIPQIYVYHPAPLRPDPGQGFSDHTSFHDEGYAACLVSEDFHRGPSPDDPPRDDNPFHHMYDDKLDVLNLEYAAEITRAVTAAAWHLATR